MATKKITASEVAGELRKAAKMYEVFKHASDAANVLAGYEASEKKLKKDIGKLQSEYDDLDKACDVVSSDTDAKKFELSNLEKKVKDADDEYKRLLSESKSKAQIEASRIVSSAQAELSGLDEAIRAAKKVEKAINLQIENADKQYKSVCSRIEKVKSDALEALA